MSRIRSRGNKKTELAMVKLLRKNRIIGWRRHQPLVGTPDFVFRKLKLAIFVDGCFWHGCKEHGVRPGSKPFWKTKFIHNKAHDRRVNRSLRACGWRVLRVWEHELSSKNETRLLHRIERAMEKNNS